MPGRHALGKKEDGMKKVWVLYDSRACGGQVDQTDEAVIYCTAESLKEALDYAKDFKPCTIYSYEIEEKNGERRAINEQWLKDVL